MATTKRNLGFANMNKEQQREIASQGGKVAHEKGVAHEFTPDEAREAGRKGGRAVSRNREHMAQIGRLGAKAKAEKSRMRSEGAGQLPEQTTQSKTVDVFQLLHGDHETVNQLFWKIIDDPNDRDRAKERYFPELKHEIETHATLEEQHFYPALLAKPGFEPLVEHAKQEHDSIRRTLERMGSPEDEQSFHPLILQLREDVNKHVAEEEGDIFQRVRDSFSESELQALGRTLQEAKTSIPGVNTGVSPSREAERAA